MTKEYLESILTEYGVAFTDSLADRLLKEFEPSNDMVSRGVFEQVMWERDVATEQLKELGYELGQKVEPCEDAISRTEVIKSIDEREDVNGKVDAESVRTDIALMSSVKPQEPCEDEYIKVPKKALKYRTAGMVAYNAEWLKNHFDIERAVICGAQEPTTMNDLALIHTEGLDEEIRCAMCTNSMKSNRGCDGSCVVNKDMYKAVMDAIEKRIQPTTKNDVPENNVGDIYECSCGYGWDKSKVVRHHFCPNCGRAVEPSYNSIKTNLKPCDGCRR